MEWVFFWLIFAIVVGVAANTRGRSGFLWFLIAVVLSPILAGLLVLALPKIASGSDPVFASRLASVEQPRLKKCPDCAEMVQADAKICRFCRHEFPTNDAAAYVDHSKPKLRTHNDYMGVPYKEYVDGTVEAEFRGQTFGFASFNDFKAKIDRFRR
jgi:hypothetical protein